MIESDIAYERLDTTLERYGKSIKKNQGIGEFKEITFHHVWLKFQGFKSTQIAKNTLGKYTALLPVVHSFWRDTLPSCLKLDDSFLKEFNPQVSARVLKEQIGYLSACWSWGQEKDWILPDLKNPFEGLTKMIKVEPKQPPRPFSSEEVCKIIDWFSGSHYQWYVQFLLSTGCRISEAIGLRWKHVDTRNNTIWIGESLTRGERKSTKTNKARVIPMNDSLRKIVLAAFNQKGHSFLEDELVFLSPQGKPIDDHNFNQRIWKKCLSECGIPYRRPYNCRHTFISHCLESGMSPATVASITGHDVQTLYDNYAGSVIQRPEIPGLF
ncbi:MAG TPA: site-specific integrase [Cyanobacteria bacterium UBA9226]|nr:site-specific integrase [Cyanobacteria bacterium UBA9226]